MFPSLPLVLEKRQGPCQSESSECDTQVAATLGSHITLNRECR
jgi:hypothetical protein